MEQKGTWQLSPRRARVHKCKARVCGVCLFTCLPPPAFASPLAYILSPVSVGLRGKRGKQLLLAAARSRLAGSVPTACCPSCCGHSWGDARTLEETLGNHDRGRGWEEKSCALVGLSRDSVLNTTLLHAPLASPGRLPAASKQRPNPLLLS